jgi:hypothetical protein
MVDIKMTKGKWHTVGWCSLVKPYLIEWHCEAEVNSQKIKMIYVGATKPQARKLFKELIKQKQKAWFEHLAR